jgi:PhnB protein
MQIDPYLNFNGNCEEAFHFYEKALGGKIEMLLKYNQAPAGGGPTPPGFENKVMHVRLSVGQQIIMASDAPPGHFSPMQGFNVSLMFDDKAQAERVFNALADKGKVMMPFAQTFWAEGFGMLTDRFGTPWMVNCPGKMRMG